VNDELEEIKKTLVLLPKLLTPGGRVGVISFHSLEDRLVKAYFSSDADQGFESKFQILTKKPISGEIYDVNNPRARSAKLRVAFKK
jgi:16S rRNA (cytosine1402-N4)-methyltransferase